jgi:hypothetical protein
MADAANTPEDKEQHSSAPEASKEKDEAKADSAQTSAAPDADKGVTTGLAQAPDAATKLVPPEAVPAATPPEAVPATAPKHDAHGHAHEHSGDAHGHSHDHSDDAHDHSHDAHDAHAHDDHPVATDMIPEKSWQDTVLSGLSMCVLLSFVWLVVSWYTIPLAPVTPEEAPPGAMQQR